MSGFRRGLKDSLPIMAGYVPIAFAFGVATVQAGLPSALAILTSVVMFAGGSQFVLISLLNTSCALWVLAPTVLLMNARHLLYGRPILRLLGPKRDDRSSFWLAFGLTDEVFATAATRMGSIAQDQRTDWYIGLQMGAYLSWVAGTAMGGAVGVEALSRIPALNDALSFVLPAFFFSLLLAMDQKQARFPALGGVVFTFGLLMYASPSVAIPFGMLGGAVTTALLRRNANGN